MRRLTVIAAAIALALPFGGAVSLAQGVAPGGGIGNSTGIGSGLGGQTGTGPGFPNGTNQAPQPSYTPPPPGGGTQSAPVPRGPSLSSQPSPYPQPRAPFESAPRAPATVPLSLPDTPSANLSFLKGCWRTDVFQQAGHPGTTTYCFDDKGVGRFLHARQDQADYFCRGSAEAAYVGAALRLHGLKTACSDGGDSPLADLDCRASGEAAECSGAPAHLYRVR